MKVSRIVVLAALLAFADRAAAQGPPAGSGRPVVLEGDLDVLYEDHDAQSRLRYFLDTTPEHGRRRVPLRFNGNGPDLPSGSRVRIAGDLADDGTLTGASVTTIAASAARTLGEQTVLVILLNFSTNPVQPYTPGSIDAVNAQVRDLIYEHSYRQTIMTFTVTGWHTIAASNATCDYSSWATMADEAATAAGFNIAAYARRVYAFPYTSACAWWGVGNVGGPRSYINGTYSTRVVAHEQGHNFGNRHSHALHCAGGCVSVDYGDDRDVMGAAGVIGHTNAFQKERLGWLNYGSSPVIQTVSTSGDYWIDNYSALAGNNKALKIWNAAAGNYYYFESRERVGFDATVPPGVTVHTGSPSSSDSSFQLDLDTAGAPVDSTLDVGQTVEDRTLGVIFTTLSSDVSGAMLRVSFNAAACVTAAPAMSMSPSTMSGAAGATLNYSLTVTNKNSSGCAASPYTFAAATPSGWSASFNPASAASLAPGASVTTTLALTSPAAASGSHAFSVSATDGSSRLSTSASGSATIAAAAVTLSATATAVVPSTGNGRTATLSVTVKNGSALVSRASVTATITGPTGVKETVTGTTDVTGVATIKYSIKPRDPAGTYTATVVASASGATATTAASFVMR